MEFGKTIGEYECSFEVYQRKGRKDCSVTYWCGNDKLNSDELPYDVAADFEAWQDEMWEEYDDMDDGHECPIEWNEGDR
jgi:hypothetical protein